MKNAPIVGMELVDYLRETFDTRALMQPGVTLADVHRIQGEQKVIDHLESAVKSQARRAAEHTITVA